MRGLATLLAACHADRWGTVIWEGLGYGAGLAGVRALQAERYIYLEPNADLRSRLLHKYVFSARETLLGTALWSSTETRLFHVLSDPLRSSLIAPDQLLKAWPNLRQVAEYEVETRSLASLLAESGTLPVGDNLLVLDVHGAEYDVLAAVDEETLARFTHIIVHSDVDEIGKHPHWLRLLIRQGYRPDDPGEVNAGGWLLLHRPQAVAPAQLSQTPESVETPEAARVREVEAELERIRAENAAHVELVASQQQHIEALAATASLHPQVQAENEQLRGQLDALEATVLELRSALEAGNAAMAQTQEALAQARQATNLSLKLQTLRENDLCDLQERYQASLQVQDRQHQMLVKLGERLGAASRYFHQLTDAPGEGAGDNAGSALSGEPAVLRHAAAPPIAAVIPDDGQARPREQLDTRRRKPGSKPRRGPEPASGDARPSEERER